MTSKEQVLVAWLRDAYAMEREAITLAENQLSRLKNYPEFQARLQEHLTETRHQADLIRECLKRYGSDVSTIKEMVTRLLGNVQSLMTQATDDEGVKYALADYSFESFEIASYRCNIAAAEAVGDTQTKADLESILAQEERMAAWLADYIPNMSRTYIDRQVTDPASAGR